MGRPARLLVEIVGDSRGLGKAVDSSNSKLGRLGSAAKTAGKAAAVGIGAGVAALGALAVSSVSSASALEQSTGAVESVFGKASARVKRFAADAADSVGLSKSAYQDLASVIGSQMQRFGQSQDEAAASTDKLITLGADLAATYGGTVSEAVEAISSLLRGERDPIERYAVGINQNAIAAELAAQGLGNLEGKAKTQAEAQATLSLLFDQTTAAQGAFGRESDTLAGQQERLRAKFENVKAELGAKLLPVATAVATFLSDRFLPAAQRLWQHLSTSLGPTIAKVAAWIRDDLVPATQRLVEWFGEKVVPVLRDTVGPVLAAIRDAFVKITGKVSDNREELSTLAKFIGERVMPIVKLLGKFMAGNLARQIEVAAGAVGVVIDAVARLVHDIQWAMDKLGRLKNAATGGFGLGNLFGFDAGGMYGMTAGRLGGAARLTGLSPLATAGLATAATGAPGVGFGGPARDGGGITYVDRRSIEVRVDGALDPVAVARQIEGILKQHDVRVGRRLTFGGA